MSMSIKHVRWTAAVLALGLALRLVLLPWTHGEDFVVWDLAAKATLAGHNVFAHHPHGYPGGPYTYLPLFLFAELPGRWLSLHTGIPFRVVGKLPIVAGDLVVAVLMIAWLRRRGHGDRAVAAGCALWFLNPLVLYNGAFYGRFDSVCVALVLAAVLLRDQSDERDGAGAWRWQLALGAAIAVKTYPLIAVPYVLVRAPRGTRWRTLGIIAAIPVVVSLPYLVSSPRAFWRDTVEYSAHKHAGGLSWQTALTPVLGRHATDRIGSVAWIVFLVLLVLLLRRSFVDHVAAVTVAFLLCSKVVLEQYLLWALPFLVLLAVDRRTTRHVRLVALLTVVGSLQNAHVMVFGHPGSIGSRCIDIVLGVGLAAFLVAELRTRGEPARATGRASTRRRPGSSVPTVPAATSGV